MMHQDPIISWPNPSLNDGLPSLQTGRLVLFEGDVNVNEWILSSIVANEVRHRRAVHWIDGGTRFDPGRFAPLIRVGRIETEESMQRLYICRGFTAHQLSEQIYSVCYNLEEGFVQTIDSRLLVISDMPIMYGDSQIRTEEGCSMLRRALLHLRRFAVEQGYLVLISHRFSRQNPFSRALKQQLHALIDEHFLCCLKRRTGRMNITWSKAFRSIGWNPNEGTQTRLDAFNQHQSVSRGILEEPLDTWCSSHPKAERIADIDRNAIGT